MADFPWALVAFLIVALVATLDAEWDARSRRGK